MYRNSYRGRKRNARNDRQKVTAGQYEIGEYVKIQFVAELKPAIYSKAQTVEKILAKLKNYPEQKPGAAQAFKGNVIEFVDFDGPECGQPVGTLSEIADVYKDVKFFIIRTRDNKKVLIEKIDNNFVQCTKEVAFNA